MCSLLQRHCEGEREQEVEDDEELGELARLASGNAPHVIGCDCAKAYQIGEEHRAQGRARRVAGKPVQYRDAEKGAAKEAEQSDELGRRVGWNCADTKLQRDGYQRETYRSEIDRRRGQCEFGEPLQRLGFGEQRLCSHEASELAACVWLTEDPGPRRYLREMLAR